MDFKTIDARGTVEGFCIVKSSDSKTSTRGDTYLDMMLSDKSGEINAKLWSYNAMLHGEYASGDLVKVRGTVSQYNGADQLRIEQIRKAKESDGIRIEDYVASAEYSGVEMYNELIRIAGDFSDKEISSLVLGIYGDFKEKLLFWPAAFRLHHAIRGGLLMHTLSIVRLCQAVKKIYPFINEDLLIAGAMLHDVAKTVEYDVGDTGVASGYTVKGNLIGHLAEGAIIIRKKARELGISDETSMLLEHMVLSHHGEPEFGAAVRPMFIEAELLSELDLMDARIYEMREAVNATQTGEFTGKLWAMDNRKLYNHHKSGNDKNTNLF